MKTEDLPGGRGGTMGVAKVSRSAGVALLGLVTLLGTPGMARAGKLSWLDDVMQEVIVEARAGGKGVAREVGGDGARAELRRAGRMLLTRDADEGLEHLIRQSNEMARAARRIDRPAEALLEGRFSRLLRHDPQTLRTFSALELAEKRLVVELGETAQLLARRYPAEAETMVRKLGPEGLTAVRVFGDDVAEVLVKEGPESLGSCARRDVEGGRSSRIRCCPTRRSSPPRACSRSSWPTRKSSSITPAGRRSSPYASSPGRAFSSHRPSGAVLFVAWIKASARHWPPMD